MAVERMPCCGGLTHVYRDSGSRVHESWCVTLRPVTPAPAPSTELVKWLSEVCDKAHDVEGDASDAADIGYAQGVGDFAGFLWARLESGLSPECTPNEVGSMRATNGQLADVLYPRDDED